MDPLANVSQDEGLIPRSIRDLFDQVNVKRTNTGSKIISIYIQYIQLYNEKVYDLLNSPAFKNNGLEGVPNDQPHHISLLLVSIGILIADLFLNLFN